MNFQTKHLSFNQKRKKRLTFKYKILGREFITFPNAKINCKSEFAILRRLIIFKEKLPHNYYPKTKFPFPNLLLFDEILTV